MNYCELINKKIISIFDGKIYDFKIEGIFNKQHKLSKFLLFNELNQTKTIDIKDIFKIGEYLIIKNDKKFFVTTTEKTENFLNKTVFDIDGNCFGKVLDYVLDDKFFITKIITEKTEFSPDKIITNKEIIIINCENTNFKQFHFKPKTKIEIEKIPAQKVVITNKIPIKVTSPGILGKKLFKDVISKNNVLIAKKYSIVTNSILTFAKEQNCLNELFISVI